MDQYYMEQYSKAGGNDDDDYGADDNKARLKAAMRAMQASFLTATGSANSASGPLVSRRRMSIIPHSIKNPELVVPINDDQENIILSIFKKASSKHRRIPNSSGLDPGQAGDE